MKSLSSYIDQREKFGMSNSQKKYINVIVEYNEKILIVQRANYMKKFGGCWGLPGGSIEGNDPSIEYAGARELMEETGIQMHEDDFNFIKEITHDDGATSYVIACKIESKEEPVINISREHQKYSWISWFDNDRKWMPDFEEVIKRYLNNIERETKESLRIGIYDEVKVSVCESLRIGINDKPEYEEIEECIQILYDNDRRDKQTILTSEEDGNIKIFPTIKNMLYTNLEDLWEDEVLEDAYEQFSNKFAYFPETAYSNQYNYMLIEEDIEHSSKYVSEIKNIRDALLTSEKKRWGTVESRMENNSDIRMMAGMTQKYIIFILDNFNTEEVYGIFIIDCK